MEEKDKNIPEEPPANEAPAADPKKNEAKLPMERLYDKIPLTYKQVDIIVKVLVGILVVVLVLGFIQGNR